MFKRDFLAFAIIFLLAAFLRLYALAIVPPAPSLDEVSIGYNAYSILYTGTDEYGYRLPLLLRAYDDWRPALYVYLVIPFVKFMGLSSLAVRFPSIILSLLAVWMLYRIGKLLSRFNTRLHYLGEVSALLLTISPWHIYISRLGHEANLGLTLTIAGIYMLFVFILEKKPWALVFMAAWFGLSLHGYQSQKLIVPVLLLSAGLLYGKQLLKEWKILFFSIALFSLIALPAVYVTVTGAGLSRFKGTSAFSVDAPVFVQAFDNFQKAKSQNNTFPQLVNHRKVVMARVFLQNYFSHFSPSWLFTGSAREAHKVPYMGLLYPWEIIGIVVGVGYILVLSHIDIRIILLLLAWVLSAPLPASITTQAPHAMRAYTLLPALSLIGGIGWLELWYVSKKLRTWGRWMILILVVLWSLLEFWKGYFVIFPTTQSDAFQYAMEDTMSFVTNPKASYKKIEFANSGNLYQSYMFYLFYTAFDPVRYQALGGSVSGGYDKPHMIENVRFRVIDWSKEVLRSDTIYIADSKDAPVHKRVLNVFRNLDGKEAIIVFTL